MRDERQSDDRSASSISRIGVPFGAAPCHDVGPDTRRERRSRTVAQDPPPLDAAPPLESPAAPAAPLGPGRLAPVAVGERLEALDVVRGFALFGIFLMNIEFFNRPYATFDEGMPRGLTGIDWLASWFVAYFVQGKFWTIFSLIFGMGFAVMLVRAERAGRDFVRLYLRRALALAVFGAVHFIYVWEGDILFSYAVGALALLIVLYGKARPIVLACLAFAALGTVAEGFFAVAGGLAAIGLLALYLRGDKRVAWRGVSIPLFSFILLVAGAAVAIVAIVFWLLPEAPREPRGPLSVFGPLLVVAGWLSWQYHEPAAKRSVRMAVGLFVFAAFAMTAMGIVQHFTPDPDPVRAPAAAAEVKEKREKALAELAAQKADEIKAVTRGSYLDTVALRGRHFLGKAAGDAGFAVLLVGMFVLGAWFVRSGVMAEPDRHLAFFRRLALYGLPAGIGLGVLTGFIAMSHTPGDRHDGWLFARGLFTLGNLAACLGYVGLVVTMLSSRSAFARIRVLAAPGRMALTNYLLQSLLCMTVFYGFGLGRWGMPRAQQLLFVVVVFAAQVAFSHWWLARFRYGPMEWLWRGFTYREVPPLRIAAVHAPVPTRAA